MVKLTIKNVYVAVDGKEIIKGLSLTVRSGEIHVIMGPNGSGKSTLAYALMGHPGLEVRGGKLELGKKSIHNLKPNERAKLGLFLAFQNPHTVSGVSVSNLLRAAYHSVKRGKLGNLERSSIFEFNKRLESLAVELGIDKAFLQRSLNDGFSGGEKKKIEMLQALVLEPKVAIFDEIDTGLDIDALKVVAKGIASLKSKGAGTLIITHYQRLLHYVKPDYVHILIDGKIVQSGGYDLAEKIEREGYKSLVKSS